MTEKVKFFFSSDALTELEDQYVGNETELRKELQTFIKNLFANTKADILNKVLICNIESDGENGQRTMKRESIPFKDIDFSKYKVPFDSNWKPLKVDDIVTYELAVGDSTWKKLVESAVHFMVKVEKFNDSLKDKTRKADVPVCFEEVMFQQLHVPTMQLIMKKVGQVCEDEFEELNKIEDAPKPNQLPKEV